LSLQRIIQMNDRVLSSKGFKLPLDTHHAGIHPAAAYRARGPQLKCYALGMR